MKWSEDFILPFAIILVNTATVIISLLTCHYVFVAVISALANVAIVFFGFLNLASQVKEAEETLKKVGV